MSLINEKIVELEDEIRILEDRLAYKEVAYRNFLEYKDLAGWAEALVEVLEGTHYEDRQEVLEIRMLLDRIKYND